MPNRKAQVKNLTSIVVLIAIVALAGVINQFASVYVKKQGLDVPVGVGESDLRALDGSHLEPSLPSAAD